MVVPAPIACAAQNGNVTAVEAWLNEGGDVNDCDELNEALRAAAEAEPDLRDNDIFVQTKALIDDVRAAGSWKLYCRQDHKKILRLRSLVARGRATPKKWSPRGHDRRAIEFIVKIGDNGIAWKILSFWKET